MNTDTATIAALVTAYRKHRSIVDDGDLHGRWPGAGDAAVEIGGTYGDSKEAILRTIALWTTDPSFPPLDLMIEQVRATATWVALREILEEQGVPFPDSAFKVDALVADSDKR